MGVAQWIPDLAARLAQLEGISQMESFIGVKVWLGGLFFPEAYVTATRQAVAQRNSWSLETLYLNLDIDQPDDNSAFEVEGTSCLVNTSSDLFLTAPPFRSCVGRCRVQRR